MKKKKPEKLVLYPYYTGQQTLEEVLQNPVGRGLLWLEILFNDQVSWEEYFDRSEIRDAYKKACVWYGKFKTMIGLYIQREPLKGQTGTIDEKDYRKFLEALNFVSN